MTPFEIFIQVLGFLGMAGNVLAQQFKKQKWLLAFQFTATSLFMVHYLLLGSWGGVLMNIVATLRSFILLISKKTKTLPYLIGIDFLFGALTILNITLGWDSYWAILPGVGCMLQSIGLWSDNPKKTRWYQLLGSSPCWLTYNAVSNSWGGMACEAFTICSSLIYLIRHRKDKYIPTPNEETDSLKTEESTPTK